VASTGSGRTDPRLAELTAGEPWFRAFHDLMPYRVREILLVSPAYDAFILEEDGHLTERLFVEYSELNLPAAPRITHVTDRGRAMRLLDERSFDLVLTTASWDHGNAAALGRSVKRRHPHMPVVVLTFQEAAPRRAPPRRDPRACDGVFLWTGDARILLAIVKLIEDARNAGPDTQAAGVQVLVVVEDSVRRYSTFLALLYSELMQQSQSLIAEGLNDLHRMLRMRARPKILLASTFEEALELCRRFRDHLLAVISDVRFPKDGVEAPEAGFELLGELRRLLPELPVLMQSAEPQYAQRAAELGVLYADKGSPRLPQAIRGFLLEALGFGDFVFRLPDRTEIARARDMYELRQALGSVPAASLAFHAARDHFNVWLRARSMFRLADLLRRVRLEDFADLEALRCFLLDALELAAIHEQEGVIADFSRRPAGSRSLFVRLGGGSIGGKGRGIAFVHSLLARRGLTERWPGLEVRIPRTLAIGTDELDRCVERAGLPERLQDPSDDADTLRRFLQGGLSEALRRDLFAAALEMPSPLAVRSSSLLEDSRQQSFAGVYATYMLPNNHPDPALRMAELERAILAVYASAYSKGARSYLAAAGLAPQDERMSVLVQQIVGRARNGRHYPAMSGVALSYDYYPLRGQAPEDGTVLLALGLGHSCMRGGNVRRFSPAAPELPLPVASAAELMACSQRTFYAVDLSRPLVDFQAGPDAALGCYDLRAAEQDGTLALAGSVYCAGDDVIRDSLDRPGPRLVTFHNVLKWNALPLAPALRELLALLRDAMGCAVEIEFAAEADAGAGQGGACLYVLQVRPLIEPADAEPVQTVFPAERLLCRSGKALGHGVLELRDVVYVRPEDFAPGRAQALAAQVGELDARLRAEGAPYLLIGPGRWGSADPTLGIPVAWPQIAGARVIVETGFPDRVVEPSQGSHFFHNLAALRIGYLCVRSARAAAAEAEDHADLAWLESLPELRRTAGVRHLRLERPLRVHLDGRSGRAAILKPAPAEPAEPGPPSAPAGP
jgi:hypothetical protein